VRVLRPTTKRNNAQLDINNNVVVDQNHQIDQLMFDFHHSLDLNDHNRCDQSCQTEIVTREIGIQTDPPELIWSQLSIDEKYVDLDLIRSQLHVFQGLCVEFSSRHLRALSVILYTLLRSCGLLFNDIREIFLKLELHNVQGCHSWLGTIRRENCVAILRDKRGQYERILFYEMFPELEQEAKIYAIEGGTRKDASFSCLELAQFVDKRFKELYAEFDFDSGSLIR
jgi:hypothetical protein